MNLYLDSVVVIYLVEQHAEFGRVASQVVLELCTTVLTGNELVRMESLILPRRRGDKALEAEFEQLFARYQPFVPLDRAIFERATDLRAKYRVVKTPDALHLATAIAAGCDVFVTNDTDLTVVSEIRVIAI